MDQPFTIETDASEWAVGAALYQMGIDKVLHPVAFSGRKLQGAELNYPVHEKEGLAIKEALRAWDNYVENGQVVTILTDYQSLRYLNSTKGQSKRIAR